MSKIISTITEDPFRLFFPLGILFALFGTLLWVELLFHQNIYPLVLHRHLMTTGFLLSFVTGFLMTAIPRFTQSEQASVFEVGLTFICLLLASLLTLFHLESLHHFFATLTLASLIFFAFKRFQKRKKNPPPSFLFVGLGLILWLLALLILFSHSIGWKNEVALWHATQFYTHGALLSLVLGVGGRLIPAILGWTEIVSQQNQNNDSEKSLAQMIPLNVFILLLLFLCSFPLEFFLQLQFGRALRAFVVLYFAIAYWRVHHFPKERNHLTWGIWLSAWCFVIGIFSHAFWLSGGVHSMHILYIGGFGLLTLLIATQVSLLHSDANKTKEKKSKKLLLIIILTLLAMITRVFAFLLPRVYLSHLAYAAIFFAFVLILWSLLVYRYKPFH